MAGKKPNPLFKLVVKAAAANDIRKQRKSGGTALSQGNPVVLLTTVGRKSGQERTVPLFFTEDDDRIVVVASYGGQDVHPAWWLNLRDAGEGWVEVGGKKHKVTPTVAEGPERERLWKKLTDFFPNYDKYEAKTARKIPVVVLTPAG
ncbi:nitroreductase family deazaflavin-dependent oxidoreductase [Antrihabitans cavernicola]|uniref:nitroreductase family deazaflavin-dependent oxidoreductase n=1 Tax=Antrihabitans cavernicola TaxID=2495913 RepID=UPI001658D220|nr:nitroreductase family deazaflavin-dependent oxidoreductase [Spelaeibacter cavernicola]